MAWTLNAPHATKYYRFYLTKEGFDPGRPLRWDDLELIHDSGARKAARVDRFTVDVPQRTGRHILYTVWQRSDSPEAFYSCSDVVFGAQGDLPRNPPPPDETRNLPGGGHSHGGAKAGPRRLSSKGIRLRRTIETDWGSGYCAKVTVTNRSKRTRAWKATMRMPDQIESIWNVVSDRAGTRMRVRGEAFNRVLRPGASTSFGFCASRKR
jgi:chitin-binding protein